jgi:hypothetical protein
MYKIEIEGLEPFEVKTKMTEFTLKEFENISTILNDKNIDSVDKYLNILERLNTPEEILDELDSEEFLKIVETFTSDKVENTELTRTIQVDGYTYEAYPEGKEFKLKARDFGLIENAIKKNPNKYVLDVIAIIFKRTDLSRTEHYTNGHIKQKKKLFANQTADLYYPYIGFIHDKISKKIKDVAKNNIDLDEPREDIDQQSA